MTTASASTTVHPAKPCSLWNRSSLRNPCILKPRRRSSAQGESLIPGSLSIRQLAASNHLPLRSKLEYFAALSVVTVLGTIPRGAALAASQGVAWATFHCSKRLRRIAEHNLKLALPELDAAAREQIVRGVFANLGRLLAEFCQLPKLNAQNVSDRVIYDG